MSAVDVLAVMDREIKRAGGSEYLDGLDLIEARAAVAELIDVMSEVAEYLRDRSDVIDGDYGVPAPNLEMSLLREVDAALARANPMTREQQAEQAGSRG